MLDREDSEYLCTYIAECLSDMEATALTNSFGDDVKIPMKDFRLWITISQWGYQGEKAVRLGFRSSTDAPLKQSLKVKSSEGGNWLLDQRKLRAKVQEAITDAQDAHDNEVARKQALVDFKESLSDVAVLGEIRAHKGPGFEVDFPAGSMSLRKTDNGKYAFRGIRLSPLYDVETLIDDGRLIKLVEACNALTETDKEAPEST